MNASLSVAGTSGRWEVQVYGKTPHESVFYDNLSQANTAIAAEWGVWPRCGALRRHECDLALLGHIT